VANAQRRTLTQMLTSIRYALDDSSANPRWTDANLTDLINHNKDGVWNEVRKERKDYFLSTRKSTDGTVTILSQSYTTSSMALTASATLDLTLPPDFIELRSFRAITSGYEWVKFTMRTASDLDYRAVRAYPYATSPVAFYGAIENELTLALGPMTDTALDTELVYIFQPVDLDSVTNTTLQMPYPLYKAVEAFTISDAFVMDDDPRGAVQLNIARSVIANVIGVDVRQSSDPIFVESADAYF